MSVCVKMYHLALTFCFFLSHLVSCSGHVNEMRRLLLRLARQRRKVHDPNVHVRPTTASHKKKVTTIVATVESTFEEMLAEADDKVYPERFVWCTIVAVPEPETSVSHLFVAEDTRGVSFNLNVYDAPADVVQRLSVVGTRCRVLAPYFRTSRDNLFQLRVEWRSDVCLVEVEDRTVPFHCWTCLGPLKSGKTCGGCKRAVYCSQQCQKYDWKELLHKDECKIWQKQAQL